MGESLLASSHISLDRAVHGYDIHYSLYFLVYHCYSSSAYWSSHLTSSNSKKFSKLNACQEINDFWKRLLGGRNLFHILGPHAEEVIND